MWIPTLYRYYSYESKCWEKFCYFNWSESFFIVVHQCVNAIPTILRIFLAYPTIGCPNNFNLTKLAEEWIRVTSPVFFCPDHGKVDLKLLLLYNLRASVRHLRKTKREKCIKISLWGRPYMTSRNFPLHCLAGILDDP